MTFTGLYVALATPFTPGGEVDAPAFTRLVRHVLDGGADGVVVLGSTGEAATPAGVGTESGRTFGRPLASKPSFQVCRTKGRAERNFPSVRSST